jgi:hypothetical protein
MKLALLVGTPLSFASIAAAQEFDVLEHAVSLLQKRAEVLTGDDKLDTPNGASPMKSRYNHANKCLDYHTGNNNVYMHNCHTGANQQWYMDNEQLKTNHDNKCLDMHLGNSNVYMHACHSGDNQQWFFDGENLKTRSAPSKCLDYNYNNGNIYMHSCHGGGNQEFYYTHPANAAYASKVKSKFGSQCMEIQDGGNIHFAVCNAQESQKFYLDGWELKSYFSDKCADYNYNNNNVYMHACHGGNNQQWYFDGQQMKTNYNNKCLDLHKENGNVYMHNCHSGSNQQFYLESVSQGLEHQEVEDEIIEQEDKVLVCKNWCYSKKHADKEWDGQKCSWNSCAGCSECPSSQ